MQISTDEVYGSVPTGASRETDELKPRNPYSASKAGADRLAYSFFATYGLPVDHHARVEQLRARTSSPRRSSRSSSPTRSSEQPLPLYGDGQNVRDWLHVIDHCRAVDLVIERGVAGEVYNVGGGNEVKNVDLSHRILELTERPGIADSAGAGSARPRSPLRARHDEASRSSAGRRRCRSRTGSRETVEWYRNSDWWWRPIKEQDAAYRAYYQAQYGHLKR